jgi:hypothetical protein
VWEPPCLANRTPPSRVGSALSAGFRWSDDMASPSSTDVVAPTSLNKGRGEVVTHSAGACSRVPLGLKYYLVDRWSRGGGTSRSSAWRSGPVRFFGPKSRDRDRDQSAFILELKKTGPDRKKPKTAVLDQS